MKPIAVIVLTMSILIVLSTHSTSSAKRTNKAKKWVCVDSNFPEWKVKKLDRIETELKKPNLAESQKTQLMSWRDALTSIENCDQLNSKLQEMSERTPSPSDMNSDKTTM